MLVGQKERRVLVSLDWDVFNSPQTCVLEIHRSRTDTWAVSAKMETALPCSPRLNSGDYFSAYWTIICHSLIHCSAHCSKGHSLFMHSSKIGCKSALWDASGSPLFFFLKWQQWLLEREMFWVPISLFNTINLILAQPECSGSISSIWTTPGSCHRATRFCCFSMPDETFLFWTAALCIFKGLETH